MANTEIAYQEVRLDVRDPEQTHVFVFIDNLSNDGLLGVHGWHYKSFPASMSIKDIIDAWADGKEEPLLWTKKNPE